jgi:NADPH-dependent 2,4-dienoyl-CoA reductase/sulfur reductase-like enzyme
MEARPHSRDTYAEAGKVSWVEQDFLDCSGNFKSSFDEQFSDITYPPPLRAMSHKPKVGIVGAGIAGLRCAEVLIDHGVEVTVLEARNRIGGRVHQAHLVSHPVDM